MSRVVLSGVSTLPELVQTLVRDYESYRETDICTLSLRSEEMEFFDLKILPRWMKQANSPDMPLQVVVPAGDVKLNAGLMLDARFIRLAEDSSAIELLADEGGMRILYTSAPIDSVQN